MAAPPGALRITGEFPSKVAAVCFRRSGSSIEFLLVQTDSGRWTFPKGTVEAHLGPRESALQEALEEAGVKGRISDRHFTFYTHDKRGRYQDSPRTMAVAAYLLHVRKTVTPEEDHRNPSWFCPREAKLRLGLRRSPRFQREFARVVDRAVEVLHPNGSCTL